MPRPTLLIALVLFSLGLSSGIGQTKAFDDTFAGGSTINANPLSPLAPSSTAASYQQLSAKSYSPNPPSIAADALRFGIVGTSSGFNHVQALFTEYPVFLDNTDDYIELQVTFVPEGGILTPQSNSTLFFGLFDANQVPPLAGGLAGSVTGATAGGAQSWQGYANRLFYTGGNNGFVARTGQLATAPNNQDVLYNFAGATTVGANVASSLETLATGETYIATFRITRTGDSSITLAGALYAGASPEGTPLYEQVNATSSVLTFTYDALAFGWRATGSQTSVMTVGAVRVLTTGNTTIKPEFLLQPLSQTKTVGDSVTLAAAVDGGPGSSTMLQWRKGGDDLPGETAATLLLTDITTEAAGDYVLVAQNSAGTVSSATATLTVTTGAVPPSVLVAPVGAVVETGRSHTFAVTANGTAPLTYQWQRSQGEEEFTPIADATESSYTVPAASLADSGRYRVIISNALGSITSDAVVFEVQSEPEFTAQPAGVVLAPGGSLTLEAAAAGTPAPVYQWFKDGSAISGATAASLVLDAVTGASAGNYRVTATNAVGSVSSDIASVVVVSASFAPTAWTPSLGDGERNPDTRLTLVFNGDVTPGFSGLLRIHDASNDSVVDTIDLKSAIARRDTLRSGSPLATQLLPVQSKPIGAIPTDFNYYPITVAGDTATIHPRNGVLSYGKTYYVTVDAGVFLNAEGESFSGVSDSSTWRFTIKATGPVATANRLVVAADGSGDFDTLQGAIDFVPNGNASPVMILLRNGVYFEQIAFTGKHAITVVGESVDGTVITYPNNNAFNNASGIYHRATFLAQSVRDFTLANLSVRNTTPQGGTQAEALIINGSGATSARNLVAGCRLYSYQDTLQINAQAYVVDTLIEGDVDFLWGNGPVFLENCDLRILRAGGYFTQIRNGSGNHGYVFRDCRFTAPAGVTGTFFGRIDPAFFPFSEVVVLDSTFGDEDNNNLLASATGASGSSYQAGWWLLNNATGTSGAAGIRYWDNGNVDANGSPLSNPNVDAFTTMPTDETTQANYRDPFWVLNTAVDGTFTGSWVPGIAPTIALAPASETVALGVPVTMRVVSLAVPAPSYQWWKDGAPIPAATAATLAIEGATAADAGVYAVVITNSFGEVTSESFSLTVGDAAVSPSIVSEPQSLEVTAGAEASFSVIASGSVPLSYQWLFNDEEIVGATDAKFTLPAATVDQAGAYRVVVSNVSGTVTSAAATLTVNAPLAGAVVDDRFADGSSTNQDLANQSLAFFNGRSANTRTDSVGTMALAVNSTSSEGIWAFFTENGAPIELGVGDTLELALTFSVSGFGGTGQDLRFGVLDSGGSRNTVNLTGGMNTSSFANDVGYALRYVASTSSTPFVLYRRNPVGQTANPNNPFNSMNPTDWIPLTESAASTSAIASLSDGTAYTLSYRLHRSTASVLVVSAAVDGGSLPDGYRIEASDIAADHFAFDYFGFRIPNATFATGVNLHRALVRVERAAPVIAVQPQFEGGGTSLSMSIGASTSLGLTATGSGLSYQWFKDGEVIDGATAALLELANVQAASGGTYTVRISNSAGSVTSEPVVLTVSGEAVAPGITLDPLSQTVPEGSMTTLEIVVTGSTPFTYQWQKDGEDIPNATGPTLTIANASAAAVGAYRVTVSNSAGVAISAAAAIAVKGIGTVRPSGFASGVTGGAAGEAVTVTNATDLKTYAESANPVTIIVAGTIDLGENGRIKLKSNKTLRGATVDSTILGTITIDNADNVIVSNLNISANTGAPSDNDGITIAASTRVLVSKCTIYDSTDGNLDVVNGSDLVTISWCKFYYTRNNGHNFSNLVGSSDTDFGAGDGRSNYRVTWQNNWWAEGGKQRMIACRFGRSHMVNNYWTSVDNDYGTESRNIAAIFSEHNYFAGIDDPLNKRTALANDQGLLKTIGNVFDACSGAQLESDDLVFTPPYRYLLLDAASVPAIVRAGAGNTIVDTPDAPEAAIASSSSVAAVGGAVNLTVELPEGIEASAYSWRLGNRVIETATAATLQLGALSAEQAGFYTAVVSLSDGTVLVAEPFELVVYAEAVAPVIAREPIAQYAAVGEAVTLAVDAMSDAPAYYQWRRNGVEIAGANNASLVFASLRTVDAGFYDVVISNVFGQVVSQVVLLSVNGGSAAGGLSASQAVPARVYHAGESLTFTATIQPSGPASEVTWQTLLPDGWTIESTQSAVAPTSQPATGESVLAEWTWASLPAGPTVFRFVVNVTTGTRGEQEIVSLVEAVISGEAFSTLASPDPLLLINARERHSADKDGDNRINLAELLRVIELYNTRSGTTRTGEYHVDPNTEDGFAPGPDA